MASISNSYSDFLLSIHHSSNVKIVCKHNVSIRSHKVLLVVCGDFIRELLESVPAEEEATLYLPDFEAAEVETFVKRNLLNESLPDESPFNSIFCSKSKSLSNSSLERASEDPKWSCQDEDLDYQEVKDDEDIKPRKSKQTTHPNRKSEYKPRNVDFDQLRSKLIPNPQSREDIKHNDIIEKQILHERAIEAYLGGDASLSQIGQQFGVKKSTLCKLLKCDKKFSGKGNKSQLFTEDEEKAIAEKALARIRTGNGGQMSLSSLRELLTQEMTRLKVDQSQRQLGAKDRTEINKSFVRRFAIRNKLERYMFQKYTLSEKRKFECDICNKSFTLKCSLVTHQKQIHFSFLQSYDT